MSNKESEYDSSSDPEEILDSEDDIVEIPKTAKDHFAYCLNPEVQPEINKSEGNFINSLLESSDGNDYPVFKGQNIFFDDWDEAVIGWKEIVPNAKYFPRRKRRKNAELETEKQRGTFTRTITNVNETEGIQHQAIWKSNVEPVTYRYIPNNGQYRLHKFCKEEREWYTVRRKNAERVTPSLKARYVQREIKRQLKKDFSRKSSKDEGVVKSDVKRSQSTNSEGCRDKTPSSFTTLVKSASDLYVENISTRLDELDREIKRDSRIRKSHDDQNRPFPFNVTKGKLHPKIRDTQAVPRKGPHEVQSVHSAFIVTPVGAQEILRPLEKITPQQRMKEDLVKVSTPKPQEESGGGDSSCSETQLAKTAIDVTNFDLERLRILPLAETSRTYIDKIVKGKQEGSTIISGTVNKRMGTQFLSSITVDDADFDEDNLKGSDTCTPIHSSRTRSMKEPNLPEIAGRRLEVSLTNYRLL